MGKHSGKKNKKKITDKTIRINNLEEVQNIKSNNTKKSKSNKKRNNKNNDNLNVENHKKNRQIQSICLFPGLSENKKQKKPMSKFKKFLIKTILIFLFIFLIIIGIWQGIEAFKWNTLAKQMCTNTNSIVVDLKRRNNCNIW